MQDVDPTIGVIAPNSIAQFGQIVEFWSEDGIYRMGSPSGNVGGERVDKFLYEEDVDMSRLPDSRIRDQLDQLVLADFARGDTVLLHGWMLARTEARQCALCSLLDR